MAGYRIEYRHRSSGLSQSKCYAATKAAVATGHYGNLPAQIE
jgi:hypothetical protein